MRQEIVLRLRLCCSRPSVFSISVIFGIVWNDSRPFAMEANQQSAIQPPPGRSIVLRNRSSAKPVLCEAIRSTPSSKAARRPRQASRHRFDSNELSWPLFPIVLPDAASREAIAG